MAQVTAIMEYTTHSNGKRYQECTLYNGMRHGKFSEYFEDGETIWVTCEYNHGLLHNLYTLFYLNGSIHIQGNYINGIKDGEWVEHDSDNNIVNKGLFTNGLKEGLWIENKLSCGRYKRGQKVGNWIKKRFNVLERTVFSKGCVKFKQTEILAC